MSPWRRRPPPRPPRTEGDPEHYSRCFIHETAEPVADAWRICRECGHVYQNAEDLIDQHNLLMDAVGADRFLSPSGVDRITTCPLCVHDF